MLLYRWRNGIPENRDPGPQRDPTKTGKPGPRILEKPEPYYYYYRYYFLL